ncbi:predicted protein [Nematostella vectensis]|uniref:G-protein coupled receptors family 1 profile domain-containing protein n=1 Tax=Nematostella vectensis TaxID=45351 RepID=A7SMD3_NEMVE|nr:predicted protein [Nematostella vectensis]|eukprot:XP_001627266.1 predicted protein [Nematostella vectensis]
MVTSSMYSKVITGLFMVLCLFVSFYPWKIGVAIIFSIIIVPVCLITSTVAFCKIFGILRRHVNVIHSEANLGEITDNARAESVLKYRKSVLGIVYVQVFFLVCYTPYFVALVIRTILGVSPEWKLAWNITTTVIYINSSMNPCLFCWRMKDIRSAVIKTVKGFRGPRDRSESRISRISPRDSRRPIWDVKLSGDRVVTCGADATIRIWDGWTGQCLRILTGVSPPSEKPHDLIVSGSQDNSISIWDMDKGHAPFH